MSTAHPHAFNGKPVPVVPQEPKYNDDDDVFMSGSYGSVGSVPTRIPRAAH